MPTKVIKKKPYQRRVSSRYMSRLEFAGVLGVHVETIKRREKDDPVWPRPTKIGRKLVLYDRGLVERFLQEATK